MAAKYLGHGLEPPESNRVFFLGVGFENLDLKYMAWELLTSCT